MDSGFKPRWLPTMIGSMPFSDVREAWNVILAYFPEIPAWPQLPQRSFLENMYVQFSERFPGVVLQGERVYVDRDHDLNSPLERLYIAYLQGDLGYGALSQDYARGLAYLLEGRAPFMQPAEAIKGQVTGPISWGLAVTDRNRRPILYDEVLAEALAHHLHLKAAWQEQALRRFCERTIIFVDEPYMSSFGSAFVSVGREQVLEMLEEVFAGISGLKGVHCCGNTDWSILLSTSVDILSLDAYKYAESLALYPEEVKKFLEREGIIAWGIAPTGPPATTETVESLVARLEDAIDMLAAKGVPKELLLQSGLITPSCGTGSLSPDLAERAFYLAAGVSSAMRRRYAEGM